MSQSVIFDTDMTFGLPGAPVDSGLALLYLLGRKDVDVKAVTVTRGNESIDKTLDAVSWLLRINNRSDIPIIKGHNKSGEYQTAAAEFLAKSAAESADGGGSGLIILSTGPLGNIYGASLLDKDFYAHCRQIICCGGLLYPLQIPGWDLEGDTTLSQDPLASEHVLNEAQNLVLMNMHIGALASLSIDDLFTIREYNIRLYYLVKEYLLSGRCRELHGKAAAFLWAMLPALYLGERELFHDKKCTIEAEAGSLEKGMINLSNGGNQVTMPDYITNVDEFFKRMHEGWKMSPFQNWPDFNNSEGEAGK
ncbi:MAG: nucleoside hydrolase [Bacteroidetes bacterium]|nr:nucleoside hydrolase [Bacteroidota bacterium]